jgi:nitroreductase
VNELKFEDVVETRRSIRKYKDTPVPKEQIVVEKKDTIKQLAKTEWAAEAPVMIVGLADHVASPSRCLNDLGIALEHIVLAATNLGLGTCWMGQTGREEMIKDLLKIPDRFTVIAVIPLGVPDETPAPKERKRLDAIVSWETYGAQSP